MSSVINEYLAKHQKTLLARPHDVGDLLMITPAVRALNKLFNA